MNALKNDDHRPTVKCTCNSVHIEVLTPHTNPIKLYCIDCGVYMFWTRNYYNEAWNNTIQDKLLKIQLNNFVRRKTTQN